MEIAQTGNTDLLVISGNPTDKEIQDNWEAILKRNSNQNGFNVDDHFDNVKTYGILLADYELVKLSLFQLMIVVDEDAILFLKSKGYRIDQSTATSYNQSINAALQKCKNIITKLKTRYNQIQQTIKDNQAAQGDKAQTSIEEILANLSAAIGFSIGVDITLARYNEYRKILKKRIEVQKAFKRAA